MSDNFPRPYINSVPKEPGKDGMMEHVPFHHMGIGARPSGLPKNNMNEIKSLDHVGKSAGGGGRK